MTRVSMKNYPLLRIVFAVAGSIASIGTALGVLIHPYFFVLPIFVGCMQILFAITGICPLLIILGKAGKKCRLV